MSSSSPRPALLPVNHPLCYSSSPTTFHTPHTTQDKTNYLFSHLQITDLLNTYAYVLDTCMVTPSAADTWVDLFTNDCELTYPFGTHTGKPGLADWCLGAETRFKRMLHMSSNFVIKFETENVAHARSTLHATCGSHESELGECFHEGGYYYWSFLRVEGEWKISYLYLDCIWTLGDSLGLNEVGAADGR